ncbi:MAG TPA: hypothetical protein DDY18_09360 [Flavobacterium sp.]|jgi:hypothetical protein|nr:hypothetical protein [Flavobacterium sp.]
MPQIRGINIPKESNIKNYLINGDMVIAQRGTTFNSIVNTQYAMDRYQYSKVGAMVHNLTQDTDVPTLAQAGYLFKYSLRLNLTTPDTSIAAGDITTIRQYVEGELAACQRYYEAGAQTFRFQNIDTVGRNSFCHSIFSVRKRANPSSVTLNNTGQTNVGGFAAIGSNDHHVLWQWSGAGSAIDFQNTANWTADAEL